MYKFPYSWAEIVVYPCSCLEISLATLTLFHSLTAIISSVTVQTFYKLKYKIDARFLLVINHTELYPPLTLIACRH